MSQALTIARPYAKAVFNHALASKQFENWQKLLQLTAVIAENSEIQSLLGNPCINNNKLYNLFMHIADEQMPEILSQLGQPAWHLIALLAENKRLNLLPQILYCFEELLSREQNRAFVTVESAFELDAGKRQAIQQALTKRFNCTVDLDFSINPELIGGLLIRRDNWVFDNSLKGQLNRLKDRLFVE